MGDELEEVQNRESAEASRSNEVEAQDGSDEVWFMLSEVQLAYRSLDPIQL